MSLSGTKGGFVYCLVFKKKKTKKTPSRAKVSVSARVLKRRRTNRIDVFKKNNKEFGSCDFGGWQVQNPLGRPAAGFRLRQEWVLQS